MPAPPIGVRAVANYIKQLLTADPRLQAIAVRGEITGYTLAQSGHLYFNLKEGSDLLGCVVWSDYARGLPELRNGLSVIATGGISSYSTRSQYQLSVRSVKLDGVGELHMQFEAMKQRFADEGLFAESRKRKLPRVLFSVALVSGRGAFGAGDFLAAIEARAPHVRVLFFPTPVQGVGAAVEIAEAIRRADKVGADAIVVARGGGSFEDLFAFSCEPVVRAIVHAKTPIITGIGHEFDQSLADLAADVAKSTPTAAAEQFAHNRTQLLADLRDGQIRLREVTREVLAVKGQLFDGVVKDLAAGAHERLARKRERLYSGERRLSSLTPAARLTRRAERLNLLLARLDRAIGARVQLSVNRLGIRNQLDPRMQLAVNRVGNRVRVAQAGLEAHNPTAILNRGYAIVSVNGHVVRDAASVADGTLVAARVARGILHARVERRESDAG
ncbi:MAG: exodeoxyribonuclease VII large subunit [Candidatus Baltobacteraceae bacterium]